MTDEMSLVVFDPIKATLAEVQKRNGDLVFDHTTESGEKELRSWVYRIRGHRSDLEKVRVAAKSEALSYGKKVDALAKELKVPYDKLITERMKPLDEIEAKKRADAVAIVEAKRLEDERIEQERIAAIAKAEAEIAEKQAAIKAEENRLTREREILEAEKRAEVDAKRREQEAKGKAEQDKKEALERAEYEKQEALVKAEREKEGAIEAEREKNRLEAEAKKAEEKRIADIECKRIADLGHRKAIEEEASTIFTDYGMASDLAKELVGEISKGIYPALTINY